MRAHTAGENQLAATNGEISISVAATGVPVYDPPSPPQH